MALEAPATSAPLPNRKVATAILSLLPFIATYIHIFVSPYTKVEESFTLHAVHDVLAQGFSKEGLQSWDHITFPGAVPRSFVPPIILGLVTYPLSVLSVGTGIIKTKIGVQILVRLVLASAFSLSLNHLGNSLRLAFGNPARVWFVLLTLGSFHIPYYAGRTLPNFMALPGVMMSISYIIRGTTISPLSDRASYLRKAIVVLTALATVVRLELALFVVPLALSLVVIGYASVGQVISWGMVGGFGSLAISSPIDYALWLPTLSHPSFPFTSPYQLLWPELSSLVYNAVEGHSADWGIMPFHYYFTNSLPKLLVGNVFLVGLAAGGWTLGLLGAERAVKEIRCWNGSKWAKGIDKILKIWTLSIASVIGGLSLLGHKEWRFILPILPIIHILSALSASSLWSLPPPKLRPFSRLFVLSVMGVNVLATGVMTFLSAGNYPGGEVWKVLETAGLEEGSRIYFPSYPLQTGATLFTFLHDRPSPIDQNLGSLSALPSYREPRWVYDKSETEQMGTLEGVWESGVDYVVTADYDQSLTGNEKWQVVGEIEGLDGVGKVPGRMRVQARWARKLAILKRTDDRSH